MKLQALTYTLQLITFCVSLGGAVGEERETAAHAVARKTLDFDAVGPLFEEDVQSDVPVSESGSKGNKLGGGRRGGGDCNNNDIAECVGMLEALTNKDLGFAATVVELNEMCPVLLTGLQCIDNYTRRCLSHKHRDYFNKLYAGTIRVIKDLCNTQGKYQEEYIRHAPCMRQVNPKYNRCSDLYHQKTANLNHITDAAATLDEYEKNRNVITLCCSFQEYLQCSERVVFETCGNETASFTKQFLDRMAGPIVQDSKFKCVQYAPGSQVCKAAGYNSSAAPPSAPRALQILTTSLLTLVLAQLVPQ